MKDLSKFDITIDRQSKVPTYRQLSDQIIRQIQGDHIQIGEFLPTENEICEISGLSRMTVRKAINQLQQLGLVGAVRGRGTFIISKETSKDIKYSIGFALRPERYIEEDPFYSQILMGVTQEAHNQNLYLAFIKGENITDEKNVLNSFGMLKQLNGLIIAGQMPKAFLDHIASLGLPCVFLNYRNTAYPFDSVGSDQIEIGRLLGKHLAELGHRECLYLSGEPENVAFEDRLKGFQEVFVHKTGGDIHILKGGKDCRAGQVMIRNALNQGLRFTAVAGGNDLMAIGAMNELFEQGYHIPEDISVGGVDNISNAINCRPKLTTIHVEKQGMGIRALQLLLERLNNPKKTIESILLGVKLIARESTVPLKKTQEVHEKSREIV